MSNIIISLSIIIIAALGCIWMMLNSNNIHNRRCINFTFSIAIVALIFYLGFIFADSERSASILSNIYYALTLWLVYFLHLFIREQAHFKRLDNKIHIFYLILCCIDSFYSLWNIFANIFYSVVQKQLFNTGLVIWGIQATPLFVFHFLNAGIIILQTFGILFYKIQHVPRIYRTTYYRITYCYIIFIIVYALVNYFNFPIDISLFMFTFIANSLFLYASTEAPRIVINKTLEISNNNSKIGICCFTHEDEVIFVNKTVCSIFDVNKKTGYDKIIDYYKDFTTRYNYKNQNLFTHEDEIVINGEKRIFNISCKQIIQQKAQIGTAIFFSDRTEELQQFLADQYKANHDALTGIYNREYFFEKANEKLRAEPAAKWMMLSSNIKDFKLINETQGEEVGDEVLRYTAELIAKGAHEDTIFGRISDDRFAVLFKQEYFDEEIILKGISSLSQITDTNGYKLQINIGIFRTDYAMDNALLMYDKADLALQNQTDKYQHPFAEYDDSLMKRLIEEKNILADFDYALRSGQFKMFLQPQLSKDEKSKGAEALVRWIVPGGTPILPEKFIPTLEKSGLIFKLDKFIWEEAAKKLAEWKKIGKKDLFISVNVSARDFFYMDIHQEFLDLVKKYDIATKSLKIEITETVLMTNLESSLKLINDLRADGFQIEIDDFGSKFSSLNMLKEIPADVLKIDMEFIRENQNEKKEAIILKNIIEMAKMLDMQVVIEGLENEEQFKRLEKTKCDLYQGFYYSKPLPVDEFEQKYL